MADYRYKTLKTDGTSYRGRISASDEREAFAKLKAKGLEPFQIARAEPLVPPGMLRFARRASGKVKARYVRQMATLLEAGLPLLEVMESLGRGGHGELAAASLEIRKALRAGERLSQSFDRHLPGFPDYVARLAELGEATGTLGQALADAAARMERQEALKSEVRSALTYPAFLVAAGVAVTLFMFFFVVPRFEALIGDRQVNLPLISAVILGASRLARDHLWLLLLALGALVGGAAALASSRAARASLADLLDRMPLIGPFLRRTELANWARTMGVAIKNGADLLTAFDLAGRAVHSPSFRQGLKEARRAVRAGEPLDEAMSDALALERTFVDLLRTGRQAAALERMLLFVADILDEEARERAKRLTAIAEPLAILAISLVVGTLVIGVVLAMTSLYDITL